MSAPLTPLLAAAAAIVAVGGLRQVEWSALGPAVARARSFPLLVRLQSQLDRAGVGIPFEVAVVATALAATLIGGVLWTVLGTPVGAGIAAGMVVAAAVAFFASAERRYLTRLAAQVPLMAQQLAGGLSAGLSLRQAIERACADLPEPAGSELRQLATELRLGARTEPAIEAFAARLPDPGLQLMVTAVLIQRSVGGNLADGLARLAAQLEDRERLVREARSATAQARMSAWLVAGLPVMGGLAVELAAPGTLEGSLGHGPGRAILVAASLLELVGVMLVRRITEDAMRVGT